MQWLRFFVLCTTKMLKRAVYVIQIYVTNDRKLLQKLLAKFNLAIFRLHLCVYAVGTVPLEIGVCERGNGIQAKNWNMRRKPNEKMHEFDGKWAECTKKRTNRRIDMAMRDREREIVRKKNHCVAANRSTFDSIIIYKITLVKSNFSIEKVHDSFV